MRPPIEIAGGGVAGLALALALRRVDIPVRVHEAGVYPRHRLCGEFLSGAGAVEFAQLGLTDVFESGAVVNDVAWFRGPRNVLHRALPEPARGISRHHLDGIMAEKLTAAGGELLCGARIAEPPAEGWVVATGRAVAHESPWLAQKAHYRHLPMQAGLEMHLGRGGYTGIVRVENGAANVCALFPASLGRASAAAATLTDRLRANGLTALADRLDAAEMVEGSQCGISHFVTGWQPEAEGVLTLGDHCAVIPPFAGHGMSLAMLGALAAAPHLAAWWRGGQDWARTVRAVRVALHAQFSARLRWAALLHPLLLSRAGQTAGAFLVRCGLLPWRWLYHRVR